jgi:hypothetical protein
MTIRPLWSGGRASLCRVTVIALKGSTGQELSLI